MVQRDKKIWKGKLSNLEDRIGKVERYLIIDFLKPEESQDK